MNHSSLDLAWVALTSALVFIMQGGFALLESGLTRSKNSINVAVKNLTDLGISVLCFWLVGFGLMFGTSSLGWIGADSFFFSAAGAWPGVFFLFQAMFCSTSATIVSGAVAERMRYSSYIIATVLMSAVIYPIAGHWAWGGALEGQPSGWLNSRGFVDFAGSTVVHSIGGWVSLAALLVIGPRLGRYDAAGKPHEFSGSSIPLAITGTMLLWFGWFGFNGGSTLAVNDSVPLILVNTSLAAAAGMIACLAVGWRVSKVPNVAYIINGSLGGLVAITAGCHSVTFAQAILIGAVGGAITIPIQWLLDWLKIDDAVGAIPVHLGAGIWGTLAVGLFGDPALLATGLDRSQQILVQLAGIASVGLFTFTVAWLCFFFLNKVAPLRVSAHDEHAGLNVAEHGATTEVYGLFQTLEQQAQTGDLSLRAPSEPFTEVGQIANQYNRVMDNLQSTMMARSEYVQILDNLQEGLFLLDPDGRIGPYHSGALETILDVDSLAGKDFTTILEALVPPAALEPWKDFQEVLFQADIDDPSLSRLNPLREVELYTGDSKGRPRARHVQFQFRRVLEGGQVSRVMVIVRDVSEEVRLKRNLELQKRERDGEMELFYRLLHLDPALLAEFLRTFDEKVDQINKMMETGQNAPKEVLKLTFRILHGLKGEAALLELDFLAEAAHQLENLISSLQAKSQLENSDFLGFALAFGTFQETGARMTGLVTKLAKFQSTFQKDNWASSLESLALRTASAKGKKIKVLQTAFDTTLLTEHEAIWKDVLVQLVKNAVVHGIEKPALRRQRGKPDVGELHLSTRKDLSHVEVTVRDDGNGLDLEKLRIRAVEAGWQDFQLAKWNRTDWVRFLFTDGVSTADATDTQAGRGVGLSLVSQLVKQAGGRIGVKFESGKSLEFVVSLPGKR